jgi:hypothetical protein
MPRQNARYGSEQTATGASGLFGSIGQSVSQTQNAVIQGMQALQRESVSFANRRLEQTVNFMEQYRRCRSMRDVLALQQRWFFDLGQDYYFQAMKLGQRMGTAVTDELETADTMRRDIASRSDDAMDKATEKGGSQARAARNYQSTHSKRSQRPTKRSQRATKRSHRTTRH